MQEINNQSRRTFLKAIAALGGGIGLASGGYLLYRKSENHLATLWRLHPAFRIHEISSSEILLWTNLGNGEKLQHHFQGVEADLLRQVEKENRLDEQIAGIAVKNNLSESACRRLLEKSLKELAQAQLIYSGEKMLVKVVEVTNG
jgi:hypothetical protein